MITLDNEAIRLITLFENLTGASVKDCLIEGNVVYFLIEEGMVGMAIGRNGRNVKNAERIIGKQVKLFEFSKDLRTFVRNLIPQAQDIKINGERVEVRVDKIHRPIVIGREKKNLEVFRKILKRNFGVDIIIR